MYYQKGNNLIFNIRFWQFLLMTYFILTNLCRREIICYVWKRQGTPMIHPLYIRALLQHHLAFLESHSLHHRQQQLFGPNDTYGSKVSSVICVLKWPLLLFAGQYSFHTKTHLPNAITTFESTMRNGWLVANDRFAAGIC